MKRKNGNLNSNNNMAFNELNSVEHYIISKLIGGNLNAKGVVVDIYVSYGH